MLYGVSDYGSNGHYLWSIFYLATNSFKIKIFLLLFVSVFELFVEGVSFLKSEHVLFFPSKMTIWSNKAVQTWNPSPFNSKNQTLLQPDRILKSSSFVKSTITGFSDGHHLNHPFCGSTSGMWERERSLPECLYRHGEGGGGYGKLMGTWLTDSRTHEGMQGIWWLAGQSGPQPSQPAYQLSELMGR